MTFCVIIVLFKQKYFISSKINDDCKQIEISGLVSMKVMFTMYDLFLLYSFNQLCLPSMTLVNSFNQRL